MRRRYSRFASVALLGIMLHALVPGGFMPASLAGGWFVELCPDGMARALFEALTGPERHGEHSHHAAADSGYDGHAFEQCDLGNGFAGPVLSADSGIPVLPGVSSPQPAASLAATATPSTHSPYRSRAPPRVHPKPAA